MSTTPSFPTTPYRALVLVLFAGLLACHFSASPPTVLPPIVASSTTASSTPNAAPSPTATVTPTFTATPSPTDTPLPTATPTPTFPPTFTPWPTLSTEGYAFFEVEEFALSLYYPERWQYYPSNDPDGGPYGAFFSPDNRVIVSLWIDEGAFGDLEAAGTSLAAAIVDGLEDLEYEADEMITLENGRKAWYTAVDGVYDGDAIHMELATIQRDERLAGLIVYAYDGGEARYEEKISFMLNTLDLAAGLVYGISRDDALVYAGGESTNPRNYDPATTGSSGEKMVYSGLVSFDPQLNLVPDLAESWEIEDGVVYTFKLRTNATFHDGRPVTAQDFVYAWERAADPETESDTVLTYLGDIVGVKEMHEGDAGHISGLKALDDHTLQVTIDAPKPYFLFKLTYPTAFVVDRENVESGEEWYRTPNGTGPYKLTRWDSFEVKIYERNEDYYLEPPQIPYVIVKLYAGSGIRLYESDAIDVSGVPYYDVARVEDPQEPLHADLRSGPGLCTSYIVFDVSQPPFDDVKVRQAFTMAFDRQKYVDTVLQGSAIPAPGLYPPALPGYNPTLETLPYDPEAARQRLAESKYGKAADLPPIVFTDSGYGSDVGLDVAAMVQMWQQNLGVTITIENIEPGRYRDEINLGEHGNLFSAGWCADYPDPENFADVLFHTDAEQNDSHYTNPELDALLEQARVEPDVARRMQLYQQAEQIIVHDAPVLFTVHDINRILVKPYLQGYVLTPISIPIERYLAFVPGFVR
ncbi:MAG: peptide ABC transporter substrate-binding protein [Chloroflexota bacterium]